MKYLIGFGVLTVVVSLLAMLIYCDPDESEESALQRQNYQ